MCQAAFNDVPSLGQAERACGVVVVGDEAHDLDDEIVAGARLAVAQQPTGRDGGEQL
jgi:hypothetical protein